MRQTNVSKTSILACVLLFLIVIAMVTEANPAKCVRHKKKRHSPQGNRRAETTQRNMAPCRRHHRYDRSIYLRDAVNSTLCSYTVYEDVVEKRVPKTIRYVSCVDAGCRCKVVNNIGTYACTQLVTNMLVTIDGREKEMRNVPYACVCASKLGKEVPENIPGEMQR